MRSRRRLTFRQVEAFQAVTRLKTVTAAAEALGLTQPAVSRLLADLERQTEIELFSRRGRSLSLTPEGEQFRQVVERSFAGLEAIAEVASDIRAQPRGFVRVAAMQLYADSFVSTAIGAFLATHPDVKVELQTANKPELNRLLALERFDLGVSSLPIDSDALIGEKLSLRESVLLFRRDSCPTTGPTWSELAKLPLIVLTADSLMRQAFFAAAETAGVRPRIVAEMRTQRAICQAVLAGGGVGLVEESIVSSFPDRQLAAWLPPDRYSWTLALVRPRYRSLSPAGQALAAFIKKHATDDCT